ncbi:unnamed protein product [Caenorhabditis nigoni]
MSSVNPDADRKISYDCLKCIIPQLEVNFRFQLSERLPKIRFAEKAVPLYISKLSISEEGFQLNDTKYRFGVLSLAREGPTPETLKSQNRRGGVTTDIDRFGFAGRSLPELTPGDILIQEYRPIEQSNLEYLETTLVEFKNEITGLEKQKRDLEHCPKEETGTDQRGRRGRNQLRSGEERLEKINARIRETKTYLEEFELEIQRHQCKRDNVPAPYDMFIELTKSSPDGKVYIEHVKYDKTLDETRKYLICKFLGNRQLVIKIKSLSFWAHHHLGLVIGLPEGIKLDVQEFKTSGNLSEVLKRLETILEHPNRPFARLESNGFKLVDAQNPKVRNAEVLVLHHFFNFDMCREIPNKKVVITLGPQPRPEHFGMIVENLIDTKGTLGTCYVITGLSNQNKAREVLRVVGERFENAIVGERLVTIPLPSGLQLDVSCAPYQVNSKITYYTIKMEVVQSQSN